MFRKRRHDDLFERVRALGAPDWHRVDEHLDAGVDTPIDAQNGWFVGDEGIDHPCTVFITKWTLLIEVRPDTLAAPELIEVSPYSVAQCGVGTSDLDNPRFVALLRGDGGVVRGIVVDIDPRHRDFVANLSSWCGMTQANSAMQDEIFNQMDSSSGRAVEDEPDG